MGEKRGKSLSNLIFKKLKCIEYVAHTEVRLKKLLIRLDIGYLKTVQ